MKKVFLYAMLAAAVLMAACGKDDDDATNNGGNQQQQGDKPAQQLGENQLMIDGTVYPLTVSLMDGMNFQAVHANGQRFTINGGIQYTEWGNEFDRTFDLTQPIAGIHCGFNFESQDFFYLVYDNTGEKIMGVLENTEYDGQSMFSSGTATVRVSASGLFLKIDGTLKNGHTFAFIISAGGQ